MSISGISSGVGLDWNTLLGGFHSSKSASVFAADISRRIAAAPAEGAAGGAGSSPSGERGSAWDKAARLEDLEYSLSGAVAYMTENYGEKAGTAMMALVYKRVGEAAPTEESLGQAFLDVTHFIDVNFGLSEGDKFLEYLNGDLNESLNAFFDNGLEESFFALGSSGGAASSAEVSGLEAREASQLLNSVSPASGGAAASVKAILTLLEEARATGKERNPDQARPWRSYAVQEARALPVGILRDIRV
ncbi:MAG: hypothetical protein LBQ63_04330 [Deltaproteobacteria bacterium]|jgi:hypothetical protein|nr:hypothetical protein [Deltaproteobacteria bacterium]